VGKTRDVHLGQLLAQRGGNLGDREARRLASLVGALAPAYFFATDVNRATQSDPQTADFSTKPLSGATSVALNVTASPTFSSPIAV
jgi:hypothetical protein